MNESSKLHGLEIEPPQRLQQIREDGTIGLAGARSAEDVRVSLQGIQTELVRSLPQKTRNALSAEARRDFEDDLLWALRSEHLLRFRRVEPKKQPGEVDFERHAATHPHANGEWGNQIVIWSGVVNWPRACIDLGFKTAGTRNFDLYELKLNKEAGEQNAALAELASYVVGYRIARHLATEWRKIDQSALGVSSMRTARWPKSHLLRHEKGDFEAAESIEWTLLAPASYFDSNSAACDHRKTLIAGFRDWLVDSSVPFHIPNCVETISIKKLEFTADWKQRPELAGHFVRAAKPV